MSPSVVNFAVKGSGISLPFEGVVDERAAIERTINLLPDFPDLVLYKKNSEGKLFKAKRFFRELKGKTAKVCCFDFELEVATG